MVEIIPSHTTSPKSLRNYTDLIQSADKLPILAGNATEYSVDKLSFPFMKEFFFLAEEGVKFERINNVMLHRLGMHNQPLYFLSDKNFKNLLTRQKKESEKAFQKYLKNKAAELKRPSKAFKPQPSSLPERQNPDEVIEIVIRPPVVLANWDSALANSFIECEEPIRGLEFGTHKVLSATAQKIFDDFNAGKVSTLERSMCLCWCVCFCFCFCLCLRLCVAVFLHLLLLHTTLLLPPRPPTILLTYSLSISPFPLPCLLFFSSLYHHVSSSFSSFCFFSFPPTFSTLSLIFLLPFL